MRHYVNDEPSAMDKVRMAVEEEKSELAADVKPVETAKPSKSAKRGKINRLVNLRKEPNQAGAVMDVAMIGTEVAILCSERDCYKVRYKDKEGYVKKYAVTEIF